VIVSSGASFQWDDKYAKGRRGEGGYPNPVCYPASERSMSAR